MEEHFSSAETIYNINGHLLVLLLYVVLQIFDLFHWICLKIWACTFRSGRQIATKKNKSIKQIKYEIIKLK